MYDASGSHSVCHAATTDPNAAGRLNWLKDELARQERTHAAQGVAGEWAAMRSVTLGRMLTTREAYAWFGTFLGLFPPMAIFARLLGGAQAGRPDDTNLLLLWGFLFLLMNAVCCLVGSMLGGLVGNAFGEPRQRTAGVHLSYSLVMAILWGAATGAAGGAVAILAGAFLGVAVGLIGCLFGACCGFLCAVPVAVATFPLFALHHRAVSHNGMIAAGRLWPLACGIPLTAAALILNLWK